MVLQKVRISLFRMPRDLMHALAKLGILVRQEISLHTGVRHLPRIAAVRRLVNAASRDRDLDVVFFGNYRVQA